MEKFPYTIVYLTNMRVPTEKAHGLATAKICEAFVDAGVNLELVAPKLWRKPSGDFFNYYKLKNQFPIFLLPTVDMLKFGIVQKAAFAVQLASFCVAATIFCLKRYGNKKKSVIFFSHDSVPLWFVSWFFPHIFYDIHHFPSHSFFYNRVMKKSFGFAVQTKWKIGELAQTFGIPPQKTVYWPNGTDVEKFVVSKLATDVRRELGIPLDKKIILYTGQLFHWKGVETLLSAAPLLPPDVLVYIVGGSDEDVRRVQSALSAARDPKIRYVSFQAHEKIPLWLRAADVLALPNTGTQRVSLYYTSPMKLFEYMASGTPIVASDIPSIREILDERTGFFMKPDDPQSCAETIMRVLRDKDTHVAGEAARREAQKYTWPARAEKILTHMKSLLEKSPTKICFLAHNTRDDNGGGVLARHVIEGISKALNAERVVFTSLSGGLSDERFAVLSPKSSLLKTFFSLRTICKSCDVIHAFDVFPFGVLAYAASFGLQKKLILTAVGSGSLIPLYSRMVGLLSRCVFRRADAVVAISRFMRDEILKKVPGISISVINPGISHEISGQDTDSRYSARVKKYQPYLLSVGALRFRKGYGVTIRAFAKIKKEIPDLNYVIVGKRSSQKECEKLQKIIRDNGLENAVYREEYVRDESEKQAWYRNAELFGLLSQNSGHDVEGFGIVFLEAAQAGLPVVGSKGCGVEDAVQDGINGTLVNERDGEAFAQAVIRILKNPALKKRMSEASLEFAKKHYWEEKLKQYLELYREII